MRLNSKARWAVGLLIAGAVLGVTRYAYWIAAEYRFTAVTEHQLYQSAEIPPDQLLDVARANGIRTVIDLRTSEQATAIDAERSVLADTGIEYVHLPVPDIPDSDTVMRFLEIMGDPANRPVLVHCHHGVGRSVLMASIFRIEFENWDNEVVRRVVEPMHWQGNFAPDQRKGAYLLSYRPHGTTVSFSDQPR